jgi:hypothetical protein
VAYVPIRSPHPRPLPRGEGVKTWPTPVPGRDGFASGHFRRVAYTIGGADYPWRVMRVKSGSGTRGGSRQSTEQKADQGHRQSAFATSQDC